MALDRSAFVTDWWPAPVAGLTTLMEPRTCKPGDSMRAAAEPLQKHGVSITSWRDSRETLTLQRKRLTSRRFPTAPWPCSVLMGKDLSGGSGIRIGGATFLQALPIGRSSSNINRPSTRSAYRPAAIAMSDRVRHRAPLGLAAMCLLLFGKLVGARGFEPPTPCSRSRCATRLRYAPTVARGLNAKRGFGKGRAFDRAINLARPHCMIDLLIG